MQLHEIRRTRRATALTQKQKPDGLDSYFTGIVQQLRPYIQALAFSLLRNRDDAEDVASEAICKAYIQLHGFTPEERECLKARAWLAEITRNLCIDYQKKEKNESLEGLMEAGYQLIAHPYSNPENGALYADAVALISICLAELSPREREIVHCVIMEDQPTTQVARNLGISTATLYVAKHRALRKLRHPSISSSLRIPYPLGDSRLILRDSKTGTVVNLVLDF